MSALCVIPARLESSRFPQKILVRWQGKTLLEHVWMQAQRAKRFDRVLIACDHPETLQIATKFGAQAILTSPEHRTGSDRIAEAIRHYEAELIINLQADEPQIDPQLLDQMVECLQVHPQADCVTPISSLIHPGSVRCVTNRFGQALYFSRHLSYGFRHVGLYGYRRASLYRFVDLPPGNWEVSESLEQLRLLEAGMSIQTFLTSYHGISVDTPEDLARLEPLSV